MFLFEKLNVYQKSIQLAERLGALTDNFSRGNWYLIDQLQRAVLSISLNIAEGNGRYHRKERCNFFWIARGSAFECIPIVEVCYRKKLISNTEYEELRIEIENITKMLSGLIQSTK